jgi:trk system potassium uptake protein TrkH
LVTASTDALNARCGGFPIKFAIHPQVVWIIIGLMLIGAAPAGTGGGIKVTTLSVLSSGTRDTLGGEVPGRRLGVAIVWVCIYFAMLAASLLLLLASEPQMSADRLLFVAASALGNVGLSHDPVSVSDSGLHILSATMLAGRVMPVLVLWWMADTTANADVAVG